MPVTFKVAAHDAKEVSWCKESQNRVHTAEGVLSQIWRADGLSCKELLQSSLRDPGSDFSPSGNGFVDTVTEAYNHHHHLVIRPDDIWQAILTQLSFYINAHAEELRSKFVAHEGKKELEVTANGSRYTVDYGDMAKQMSELLKKNVVDETLYDWVMPNYTTTTDTDRVICSVAMMATLREYFSYKFGILCGIPSITLLGEKEDYLAILLRLDKLDEFGAEPTTFAHFLRPVLEEFATAFDYVEEEHQLPNPSFWSRICHWKSGGSGPTYLGGWIAAFCVWDAKGKWQGGDLQSIKEKLTTDEKQRMEGSMFGPPPPLVLEGMRYPVIDTQDIPSGICQVDILLDDNGENLACMMVAGHVGRIASKQNDTFNTLQPKSDWFMFVRSSE